MVQPGPLPNRVDGVNIALFAKQIDATPSGESIYSRSAGARVAGIGNCGRFRDGDAAQRAFLAGGGPSADRYGIDPDGDGFACQWDPAPYRALQLSRRRSGEARAGSRRRAPRGCARA